MSSILASLTLYYGMDWIAMCFGLYGTYLITRNKRHGFLLSSIACVLGLIVATMSHQTGYMAYNLILTTMMARAFVAGSSRPT